MKKITLNLLTLIITVSIIFVPSIVKADTEETSLQDAVKEEIELFGNEDSYKEAVDQLKNTDLSNYKEGKDKVNVYVFRGSSCSHCFEAVVFFSSIAEEYGKYFNFKSYEVWANKDNASLMEDVGAELGDEVSGVPYIVIGKKSWSGFAESMADEIKSTIKNEYKKDKTKRYDVIKEVNGESSSNDIVSLLIIIIVVGVIVFGIVQTRKNAS